MPEHIGIVAERDETNRIIMDELVCGTFTNDAVRYFQQVIGRMKDAGAHHQRRELSVADARFHAAPGPRRLAPGRGRA